MNQQAERGPSAPFQPPSTGSEQAGLRLAEQCRVTTHEVTTKRLKLREKEPLFHPSPPRQARRESRAAFPSPVLGEQAGSQL